MIKAIIFDVDGVLINGEMFSKQYAKDFNVSHDKLLPFFKGRFQECLVGKADLKKEIAKHLKEWKWNKSVDELLKYWFDSEHKIDEQLVDYIKSLKIKGILCCLGTNQEKYRTDYLLQKMGFNRIFDFIFSSAYMGFKKPQKEFFQYIIDKLKIDKKDILFWDNSQDHIESARAFGFKAELYSSFKDFENKMSDYLN